MLPGEILVARLSGGATIVRFQEEKNGRVAVLLGRNKVARIPAERVMLATGVLAGEAGRFEEFCERAREASGEIDLAEVWDVLTDDQEESSVEDLAGLYWAESPGAVELTGLLICLERSTDLFVGDGAKYRPRTREDLAALLARRRREAENARDAQELVEALSAGVLPDAMSSHQQSLIEILEGYAIHGEELPRRHAARELVQASSPQTRDLQRACFEMLVRSGIFDADEPLELRRAGIRTDFPVQVMEEARAAAGAVARGPEREDLTHLDTFTIDDEETVDRDDALSLEVLESGCRLGVHIADAASLVPREGPVDREADRRMASLYLPERTIPMLPDDLTRGAGSLDPGEERLGVSLLADLTDEGDVTSWRVVRSTIRSAAALSYEQVDALLQSDGPRRATIEGLHRLAGALRRKREERGAVNLDQHEMNVKVRETGEIEVSLRDRSSPGNQMVAELMILCNSLLARFCSENGLPAVYRSQRRPDLSDLPDLSAVDERAAPVMTRFNTARRMQAARVSTKPMAHDGLGVSAYLQATSPLRRYPDLVVQRQVGGFLASGKPAYAPAEVESVAQRADVQTRELSGIEAGRKRYWFLKYLEGSRMGPGGADPSTGSGQALFEAVVLDSGGRRTALLELLEFPFRCRAELPRSVAAGEIVTLRLQGVDLWRRVGLFVHAP